MARYWPTGFTLVEVLLVVGIISVILAMAWPSFQSMMDAQRLEDSATQLRNALREARRQSMSDDLPYRVDFLKESNRLRIVPASDPFQEAMTEQEGTLPATESSSTMDVFEPLREVREIPFGVHYVTEEELEALKSAAESPGEEGDAFTPVETPMSEFEASEPSEGVDEEGEWIPVCEFFPDGSATNTTVRLTDGDRWIEVRIFGLTGEVEIGESSGLAVEETEEFEIESNVEEEL